MSFRNRAADCKSVYTGSIPVPASKNSANRSINIKILRVSVFTRLFLVKPIRQKTRNIAYKISFILVSELGFLNEPCTIASIFSKFYVFYFISEKFINSFFCTRPCFRTVIIKNNTTTLGKPWVNILQTF